MKQTPPWDQRLARIMVRPLARTPITPNQITVFTLVLALAAAALFAVGDETAANWAAGLFILARFMDHFDGELARMTGKASRLGYYLDYAVGGLSYGGLFLGIGIGARESFLGEWAIVLGLAAAGGAVLSMFLNLRIDKQSQLKEGDTVGYPGFAGFELEDGIYLIGPITWAGFLTPFFALSAAGAVVYTLWSLSVVLRGRQGPQGPRDQT